ncbi:nucleotide pyrophosphohydrolase [Candidatus Dependentiae bacterium HGW-Dependentiae-1]|nr:MAG: nucleotide pyrophosphohydrolase [Candidatus Dependentiae bacterium HGW-Dependentiae-1]
MALAFIAERDWQQFHNPKNLSMALAIEAAELMEKFRWVEGKDSCKELLTNREEIEDEAADVFWSVLSFCNNANIDISSAFERKLKKTAKRYPVDKVKGIAEYKPAKRK